MERVAALGELAGVLQLFVAHDRDGEAIAERLGVPFLKLPDVLPDAPFSVLSLDMLALEGARAVVARAARAGRRRSRSAPGRRTPSATGRRACTCSAARCRRTR